MSGSSSSTSSSTSASSSGAGPASRVEASELRDLLERWIAHLLTSGERLAPRSLCAGRPALAQELERCIAEYERVMETLERPALDRETDRETDWESQEPSARSQRKDGELPVFEGFRTVERLGRGGEGEVYRLVDLELGRTVAGKVIRREREGQIALERFLEEARALALFDDPAIVRVLEYRTSGDLPLLVMEFVDGFPLDEIAQSLDHQQRARVLAEVAEAVEHAHSRGVVHNDLKPANILLDKRLTPRVLDFGLSAVATGSPALGGTLPYMPPERLESSRSREQSSRLREGSSRLREGSSRLREQSPSTRAHASGRLGDVYALGVVLYELLCGQRPFGGPSEGALVEQIRRGVPRLPIEIDAAIPEPLQAISLKAIEREPDRRYQSAGEMARDLRRFLSGRPVLARPSLYHSVLGHQIQGHLEGVREWLELKLIYPHEADNLNRQYGRLEARDEDWIVESRVLRPSRIAMYLGAFITTVGSLLYLLIGVAAGDGGFAQPLLLLGLPFLALTALAYWHQSRKLPRVAVACLVASLGILPWLLLVVLQAVGLAPFTGGEHELLQELEISNRQFQIGSLASVLWAGVLALRTRTVGIAAIGYALLVLFYSAFLSELGLRSWLEEAEYDRLAVGLAPLVAVSWLVGLVLEKKRRRWFCRPLFLGATVLGVLAIELLALDGELLSRLGLSIQALQPPEVSDATLLDTVGGMVLCGFAMYLSAVVVERLGTREMQQAAVLLFFLTPFAVLKPLVYLSATGEYSARFDWLLLLLAVGVAFLSKSRQRKGFYYAGLFGVGAALWLLTTHNEWWERPAWAGLVVAAGLAMVVCGIALDWREHSRRVDTPGG